MKLFLLLHRPSLLRQQNGFLLYEVALSLFLLVIIAATVFTSMSASTTLAHRSITLELVNNYLDNMVASIKSNEVRPDGMLITPGLDFSPKWTSSVSAAKTTIIGGPNGKISIPVTIFTKCVMDSQVAGIAIYRYNIDCVYSVELPGVLSKSDASLYTASRQILRSVQLSSWDSATTLSAPEAGTPKL